jgi:hypothetical protein
MANSLSASLEPSRLKVRLSSQARYWSWRSTSAATAAAQRCARRGRSAAPVDGSNGTPPPPSSDWRLSYAGWLSALSEALRDGATGEALQAIVDLDLGELASIEPPPGFGRDLS